MTLSVSILHPRSIVHSSLRFGQLGPGLHYIIKEILRESILRSPPPSEYYEYLLLRWLPRLQHLRQQPTPISLCETSPWLGISRFWTTKSKYQTLLPHGRCMARNGFAMHTEQSFTKSTAWTGLSQRCNSTAKTPSETPQAYAKLTICCFGSSTLSLTSRQMPWQRPNVKTLCSLIQHPPSLRKRFGWQSSIPRCQPRPEQRTPDAKC